MKIKAYKNDIYHNINRLGLLFCFLLPFQNVYSQSVNRIDPPNWWIKMNTDTLELLVYGKDLDKVEEVKSNTESLRILSFQATESPDYLLARVYIPSDAVAEEVKLQFGKKRSSQFIWRLEENKAFQAAEHSAADVMYLISPDRFVNGNEKNDAFKSMQEKTVNRKEPFDRHGGDLQGMIGKLDYLKELGITSVWNCPLLENDQPKESYHGYAITDHYNIDQRFGSNADFYALSEGLHQREMKLVMDVVYNHCGSMHPFHSNPPFKDWINRWPEYTQTNYRAATFLDPNASEHDKRVFQDGWFVPTMPDLNQRNAHMSRYLIQNTIWWITQAEIDALRIDTYAYPDQDFMNTLVKTIRREYEEFFIFGEIWVTGSQVQGGWTKNPMLGEKASDLPSVLDFQFCFGVQELVKEKPNWASGMGRLYLSLAGDWMYENPSKLVTFVDNHDMGRIFGEVNGNLNDWKTAVGILLTSRGIPCLYYGTEILMKETANHGLIREDFPGGWSTDPIDKFTQQGRTEEENEAFQFVQRLASIRQNYPELYNGKFIHFVPKDEMYVYFHSGGSNLMMTIVSRSSESKNLSLDRFSELLSEGMQMQSPLTEKIIRGLETIEVGPNSFDTYLLVQ